MFRRSTVGAAGSTESTGPIAPATVEKRGKARDKELVGSIPKVRAVDLCTLPLSDAAISSLSH